MNRWHSGALAILALWALPSLVHAQVRIGSYQRPQVNPHPTVSPYLNLVGRGNGSFNAAIDYYGIVRPQQEFRGTVIGLQQQVQGLQQAQPITTPGETDTNLPTTGRPIGGFFNYGHYFPLLTPGNAGRPTPTGSAGVR